MPSPPDGLLKRVSTRHKSKWFVRPIHLPTPKSNTLRRYFVRCHTTQESFSSVARWLLARYLRMHETYWTAQLSSKTLNPNGPIWVHRYMSVALKWHPKEGDPQGSIQAHE